MQELMQPTNNMPTSVNSGAVMIEQERAIAEARGQMQLAKMFPRSVTASISEFLDACRSKEFAMTAFYSIPNRGSGPSIRFAEEAARCYGNFEYGHRELSRSEGKSEIEVYAWDKEKNNRSTRQITVMHVIDTKNGSRKLTDQADIDSKIANVASKQIRGRILALLPKHMIAEGIAEAKKTLAGNTEKPLRDRIIAMCSAFGKFGITTERLAQHLGHSTDTINVDEFADLTGIFNSLREGAKVEDFFPNEKATITHEPQDTKSKTTKKIDKPVVAENRAETPQDTGTPEPVHSDVASATTEPQQSNQVQSNDFEDLF